jgi:hypothetical protein
VAFALECSHAARLGAKFTQNGFKAGSRVIRLNEWKKELNEMHVHTSLCSWKTSLNSVTGAFASSKIS